MLRSRTIHPPVRSRRLRKRLSLLRVVPLVNPREATVVSRRLGNFQFSDYTGGLEDQYWVR